MLVLKKALFRVLAAVPAATLAMSLEPAAASPALMQFEPTVQFAQATLYLRIDFLDMIDPVATDFKSV